MITKEQKRQFILDTLLPYKEDPNNCALDQNNCLYLTPDGKKCAVGKHMKEGEWQYFDGDVVDLFLEYDQSEILTEEAYSMGFDKYVWKQIQKFHDEIANRSFAASNDPVSALEAQLSINLDELRHFLYGYNH